LVISDTPYQDDLIEYCTEMGVKFHFTQNEEPRTWCVTANKGVELATGENIILCHAEIYHIDKVLVDMIATIKPKTVVHPIGYDDQSGKYLKVVQSGKDGDLETCTSLNTRVSFIQGFRKEDYVGFDEDFAEGHAFEDVDFSERMEHSGCTFVEVPAKVVHLFHKRGVTKNRNAKWEKNRLLLEEKRKERLIKNTEIIDKIAEGSVVVNVDSKKPIPKNISQAMVRTPTVSLIIFCHNKLRYLAKCWPTLRKQLKPNIEVLVISDTPEQADLKQFCSKNNIRVHFTGNTKPRTWCVSANTGVNLTTGDIIIFNHAEIFHLGNTIEQMVKNIGVKTLVHPDGMDDINGVYLGALNHGKQGVYSNRYKLGTQYSCCQAFRREDYLGYDEEFADGHACEDIDFYERMVEADFKFIEIPARVVHLYHKRGTYGQDPEFIAKRYKRNCEILEKKRNDRNIILHGKHPLSNGDIKPS
jgi:GT2 family glycosyltransferase